MRTGLLKDPIEELSRLDWRSDPDLLTVDRVIGEVTEKRRVAHTQLAELAEQENAVAGVPTPSDHNAVAQLLGRAVKAVRSGIHQGPSFEARRREAEQTIAAADRQLKILRQEREQAARAAKCRVAEAIQAVAKPILEELIPATETAYALNEKLERVAAISKGQFLLGAHEAPIGAWEYLPEDSQEPAAHHTYSGFERTRYERWRLFLRKQRYL